MARHYFRIWLVAAAAWLVPAAVAAGEGPQFTPSVRVSASRARPGDALLVTVDGVPPSVAGATSGTASLRTGATSGTAPLRPLRFYPVPSGVQAILALPIELDPGTLAIEVRLPPPATSGTAGSGAAASTSGTDRAAAAAAPLLAQVDIVEPGFSETRLSVEPKFIAPSPAQKRRMEEDQAAFRAAFARPFEPPLFDAAFAAPRDSRVTGTYGERRMFNGEKKSQHYGVDLSGADGEPVRATNAGLVVLVRDAFASGKSVVVAHGAGLFSVYFHLSGFSVETGDRVKRGQVIARVGATGRVTGPHLHFGIKANDLYVDPDSVYRLAFAASP